MPRPIRPILVAAPLTAIAAATALPGCHPDGAPPRTPPTADASTATPAKPRDLGGGLIIEDLAPGSGPECPEGADITMNFTASLADGRVYDSSAMRSQPLSFSLASPGLIRGLAAGIPGMRAGGSRRIHIPWTLAYGVSGRDPVPPRTDLVFEIDLLAWKPADRTHQGRPAGAARPR